MDTENEDEYNFVNTDSDSTDTSSESSQDHVISVGDFTNMIKDTLKVNFDQYMNILGEITNYKSSKGHMYFTLKDNDASINVVMWNHIAKKINIKIENGDKVIVLGAINVFNKAGTYNLIAQNIKSVGVGDLHQEYVKLKDHYEKLGYFKDDHKKKIPLQIYKVGIITASDGAALQDFLYVLKKNNYGGQIYIKNCLVQGKGCPTNIVKCLEALDDFNLDVIVLARGGGSFEDLFGFSDKKVIEKIYKCKTPIISAIGHEVDFMLSDFVADMRAPTPSIAGEIISGKKEGVFNLNEINEIFYKIKHMIEIKFSMIDNDLKSFEMKMRSPNEIIDSIINNLETFDTKINHQIVSRLINCDSKLNDFTKIINNKPSAPSTTQSDITLTINDKSVTNLQEFTQLIKTCKKLKIKFTDGEALLDMRNIKILDG